MAFILLVIIDVINILGITLLEPKDDAPVRPDSNAPEASKIACQAVQSKAGQVHIFGLSGSIQYREDVLHFLSVIGADPFGISLFKKPSQPLMPEAANHDMAYALPIKLYTATKCDKRQLSRCF